MTLLSLVLVPRYAIGEFLPRESVLASFNHSRGSSMDVLGRSIVHAEWTI